MACLIFLFWCWFFCTLNMENPRWLLRCIVDMVASVCALFPNCGFLSVTLFWLLLIMNNILPFAILLYILILPVLFFKASFYSFCISDLKVSIDLSSSSLVSPSDVPKWLTQPLMETFPYFCCCSFCILKIFFVFFLRSVSWLTLASWCLCSHWGLSHGNCNYFKRPT